jgi:hypothetical protein
MQSCPIKSKGVGGKPSKKFMVLRPSEDTSQKKRPRSPQMGTKAGHYIIQYRYTAPSKSCRIGNRLYLFVEKREALVNFFLQKARGCYMFRNVLGWQIPPRGFSKVPCLFLLYQCRLFHIVRSSLCYTYIQN